MSNADLPATDQTLCQWVNDNVGSHVLGALEKNDADQLETHLLTCPACDSYVAEFVAITPLLGLEVPVQIPPSALRGRLLAAAAVERHTYRITPSLIANPTPVAAESPRRSVLGALASRWVVAPVVGVLLILGAIAFDSQQELGSQRDRVTQLERENAAMSTHLSSIQAGIAAYGDNASTYQLLNVEEDDSGAGGIMLGDPNQSTALLSVWNMPVDVVSYHIMCEGEFGEILAAGEVKVDERGVGTIQLNLPSPVTAYRAVHVVPVTTDGSGAREVPANDVLQVFLIEPTTVSTESE